VRRCQAAHAAAGTGIEPLAPEGKQTPDYTITFNEARFRELADDTRLDEGGSPDHGGLLAFTDAMEKAVIEVPPGVELAMDLLADEDGEIDGLRLLLSIGTTWYFAAPIYRTAYQDDQGSPLEFLRFTAGEASKLLANASK